MEPDPQGLDNSPLRARLPDDKTQDLFIGKLTNRRPWLSFFPSQFLDEERHERCIPRRLHVHLWCERRRPTGCGKPLFDLLR